MAYANNSNNLAVTQETQAKTIEYALPSGPHYNPDIREYEIWDVGEIIAYAGALSEAYRIYHQVLRAEREHFERCSEDYILWTQVDAETKVEVTEVLYV